MDVLDLVTAIRIQHPVRFCHHFHESWSIGIDTSSSTNPKKMPILWIVQSEGSRGRAMWVTGEDKPIWTSRCILNIVVNMVIHHFARFIPPLHWMVDLGEPLYYFIFNARSWIERRRSQLWFIVVGFRSFLWLSELNLLQPYDLLDLIFMYFVNLS